MILEWPKRITFRMPKNINLQYYMLRAVHFIRTPMTRFKWLAALSGTSENSFFLPQRPSATKKEAWRQLWRLTDRRDSCTFALHGLKNRQQWFCLGKSICSHAALLYRNFKHGPTSGWRHAEALSETSVEIPKFHCMEFAKERNQQGVANYCVVTRPNTVEQSLIFIKLN